MSVMYADVFTVLAHALPGCPPTEDDWREPLPHVLMQEIVSFVCQRADLGAMADMDQFATILERLASEGDNDVRDLVIDALDGLLTCGKKEIIAQRFGPRTMQLWTSVLKQQL